MPILRPISESEYQAWRAAEVEAYAVDKVKSGAWSAESALELSNKEHESLLPQGRETPMNHLYAITGEGGVKVGVLWFAEKQRRDSRIAYVYDIEIEPNKRRHGYASRALAALEKEVQSLGLAGIALHVFGHNIGAQALYAKLGFNTTNINMYKPVSPAGAYQKLE